MGGVEKVKKHAARTPVGEGGKEGGSEKRGEGGKVVRKVGILCGRCRKKLKKTCSENAGTGGREGRREGRKGGRDGGMSTFTR